MPLNQLKIIDRELFIDGTELKCVQKMNFQQGINTFPILNLEIIVESLLDTLDHRKKISKINNEMVDITTPLDKEKEQMDLNQLNIIDGKLFLDDTEIQGIRKIKLQKGINGYKTYLEIEIHIDLV
ncbi:hypothetical protein LKF67_1439 [Lactococcus lactis subsp. lactis]|uniref:hypothetical protein n=1 Tax=Lactococcus lactis TaxID=1358 RepID=UPI00071C270D|nr:hypothetical protein [Lactococcus lactis]KST90140.1 hypothetical protein LKF67_1439 [Lactococcus lactis subsp. lactis]